MTSARHSDDGRDDHTAVTLAAGFGVGGSGGCRRLRTRRAATPASSSQSLQSDDGTARMRCLFDVKQPPEGRNGGGAANASCLTGIDQGRTHTSGEGELYPKRSGGRRDRSGCMDRPWARAQRREYNAPHARVDDELVHRILPRQGRGRDGSLCHGFATPGGSGRISRFHRVPSIHPNVRNNLQGCVVIGVSIALRWVQVPVGSLIRKYFNNLHMSARTGGVICFPRAGYLVHPPRSEAIRPT